MKNTATLGQIQKVLTLLEGVPSEIVQTAIENGTLAEAVQGKTRQIRLKNDWRIVCLTMEPEEIVVTRPHEPCTYYSVAGKGGKYQVRVWKGKHGHFKGRGHVSDGGFSQGGPLLFETYEDIPQTSAKDPTYEGEMQNIEGTFPGYEWQKETLKVEGKGLLDVFTLRCMRNGF